MCSTSRKKMFVMMMVLATTLAAAMEESIPTIDPKIVVKKYTNPPKIFGMDPKNSPSAPLPLPVRPPNEMFPSSPDFSRAFEMFPSDPPMASPSRVDDSSNNRPFQMSSIKGRQPPPRWLHTAVASRTGPENKQEMIVYGGVATDPGTLNDLWVFSVTQDTWSKLERSSGPEMPTYPNPGNDQTDKQQIEIMGRPPVVRPAPVMNGFPGGPDRTQQYADMKSRYDSFTVASVQKGLPIIMPGQPPAIEPQFPAHETMSLLETNERVRLRGKAAPRYGESSVINGVAEEYSKIRTMMTAARSEIWIYDVSTREWREPMKKSGEEPAARWMHSAVLNEAEKEMIVFGGCSNSFEVLRDVWTYKIEANTWTLEWPAKGASIDESKAPKAREGHAAAMLKGNKMIVYGGITQNYEVLNDVWTYASKAWTVMTISESDPTPPARWLHSMISFGNDRTIVYGGCSETSGPLGDTWELNTQKKKWTQLGSQRHYPAPARYLHSAVGMTTGDESKFTMVVHGGSVNNVHMDDMWELDLETMQWTELYPSTDFPMARSGHSLVMVIDKELADEMKKREVEVVKTIDTERSNLNKRFRRRLLSVGEGGGEEVSFPEWVNSPFDTSKKPPPYHWDENKYVRPMTPGHANFVFLLFGGKAERGESVSESTRRDLY